MHARKYNKCLGKYFIKLTESFIFPHRPKPMIVNTSARLTNTICCKLNEILDFIILYFMQHPIDYTKFIFLYKNELIHCFIYDIHVTG